jgi:hypothetical protein
MEINSFEVIKAADLMVRTETAYMRSIYGEREWRRCILWLLSEGLTDDMVEEIMRHKHMRWANDEFGSSNDDYRQNEYFNGFKAYCTKYHIVDEYLEIEHE